MTAMPAMTAPDSATLHGELFDGVTPAAVPVTVTLSTRGELSIGSASGVRNVAFMACRIAPAVGRTPRIIGLPDGASIETRDLELLAAWEAAWGRGRGSRFVQRIENHWRYVALAVLVLVLAAAAAHVWGLPLVSRAIAFRLPPEVHAVLGEQALPTVETLLGLTPSELSSERQAELGAEFATLVAELGSEDFHYELQFRSSPVIGPNALALPSGTILLTDELVALAERDEEVLAVLAHEITHVEQRHGVRSALQDSGTAFLLAILLGDLSSVSSIGVALPSVLVQAGYSRDFEREADLGAAAWCRSRGLGPEPMRVMLERLGQAHPGSGGSSWLDSHPDIDERVRALRQ